MPWSFDNTLDALAKEIHAAVVEELNGKSCSIERMKWEACSQSTKQVFQRIAREVLIAVHVSRAQLLDEQSGSPAAKAPPAVHPTLPPLPPVVHPTTPTTHPTPPPGSGESKQPPAPPPPHPTGTVDSKEPAKPEPHPAEPPKK